MKIAICDDMDIYLYTLHCILVDFFDSMIGQLDIDKFSSGEDLLAKFTAGKYDIIILDMEMKKLNGIQTAHEIRKTDKAVVLAFYTSYCYINTSKYSIGTYTVMKKGQILQQYNSQLMEMFNYLKRNKILSKQLKLNQPIFYTNTNFENILLSDILYFKQYDKEIIINSMTGNQKALNGSIDDIILPDFIRIHDNFYVNTLFVTGQWSNFVILNNGVSIPVQDKYINDLKRYLKSILK